MKNQLQPGKTALNERLMKEEPVPKYAHSNMKNLYKHMEHGFEKLTSISIAILGNSITFALAFLTVIIWLFDKRFFIEDIHYKLGDLILGVAFLALFIIQKSFNRFSASLHLKVNELVASHELARNTVINAEEKTDDEIIILSKEYTVLAELAKEANDAKDELVEKMENV
jgi:low affinity Fe/Cu permease